jgi:hypothetical protein
LVEALVERPCSVIRRLGGDRKTEVRFHKLLRYDSVTVAEMAETVGRRTGALAAGRDIALIQDTCEIYAGGAELAEKGFGPIGKGGATRGVLAHATIAVDCAEGGGLLGIADFQVWTRAGGPKKKARQRRFEDKESFRWLSSPQAAAERMEGARSLTAVSDSESDIFEYIALRPPGLHVLVRARHDRPLVTQGLAVAGKTPPLLDQTLRHCVPAKRFDFEVPARSAPPSSPCASSRCASSARTRPPGTCRKAWRSASSR